jgi:hypothetical protein
VNCEVCGTELPFGAMFCGECGRAVGARAAEVRHPDSGMPIAQPLQRTPQPGPRDTVILEPLVIPEHEHPLDDVAPAPVVPTAPVSPFAPAALADPIVPVVRIAPVMPPASAEPVFAAAPAATPGEASAAVEQDVSTETDTETETETEFGIPPVVEQELAPEVEQDLSPEVEQADASEPAFDAEPDQPYWLSTDLAADQATSGRPDPFPWGDRGSAIFLDSDELEQTLITARKDLGQRFVLQFSTGESVTVFGTGLLGRNPIPQPGEYFDQLVPLSDPGKSVSKTHLEFGQEGGAFWVSDRYSGNGSVAREPEAAPRRLVAGRRYRVVRGTRIDIGEQFFVVS